MGTWNSRGLRGSALEELINRTNEQYREKGLALIQKIPTPITPIKIDKEKRHITLAYFDQKSTVDYIGAVQGIPVCFDAKECASDTFALQNLHEHLKLALQPQAPGEHPVKAVGIGGHLPLVLLKPLALQQLLQPLLIHLSPVHQHRQGHVLHHV